MDFVALRDEGSDSGDNWRCKNYKPLASSSGQTTTLSIPTLKFYFTGLMPFLSSNLYLRINGHFPDESGSAGAY